MMEWISDIRLYLQTLKPKLESLTEEASVLEILENNNDGLLTMIKLLNKLKCFAVQDSFYELFNLIDNIVEILGGISKKAKKLFILSTAEKCLDVVISPVPLCCVKMEVVRLLNLFLEDSSQEIHQKILKSDESLVKLDSIFSEVSTTGDIELQCLLVECLFRFLPTKMAKSKMLRKLRTDPEILSAFCAIRGNKFEVDCRNLLNKLNKQNMFVHKRVLSFPADYVKLDGEKLLKPSDDGYDDFWVDFNTGSKRISIFCQPFLLSSQLTQSDARWETLSLRAQDVKKFDCTASGKIWKIAIELKSNAQLLAHPETEDQPHLFLCGIKTMYDAKSALKETFGLKTSTVDIPLMIGKKTDSSESSCISFSNVGNHKQAPSFPASKQRISSNTSVHGLRQEKSSVPCDLMCCPASSVISQDSSASSSLCVPDVRNGKAAVQKQNKSDLYVPHNKDKEAGCQSFKDLKSNHINTSDSMSTTNFNKKIQVTQKVETHDKNQKLQGKSGDDKSENYQKRGGKYSTKKCTGCPESKGNVSALKRSGNEDFSQKGQISKQLSSGSVAPGLIHQHLSPMTPGGDGFSLSIVKPENNRRQKSSFPSSQASKVCVSGDKQSDIAEKQEDHNVSTDIIPDSLPVQAPQVSRLPCETMTTTKANKSKTKTTLRDVLGSDKTSKIFPSRCEKKKSVLIKTYEEVVTEVDKTDKPMINSDSKRCKKTKKRPQSTKREMSDTSCNRDTKIDNKGNHENQRDRLKNKKHHAPQNSTVSFSPRSDQLIDIHSSKQCVSLSKVETQNKRKFDIESLSTASVTASSEYGELYIETDTTAKNKEDNEDIDEVIAETQIETSRPTATGKINHLNTQKKTTFSWPSQESNDESENQGHSGRFISNGFAGQPHSVPMESSYIFKNKNKESAPLSNNPYMQTISSKMVSKGNEKKKDMAISQDTGGNLKNKNDPGKTSNGMKQSKNSSGSKCEKKQGSKTLQFAPTNVSPTTKNQVKEKRAAEERQSRPLRARKNTNYNETELFNQGYHEDVEQPPLSNVVRQKKQNERLDWQGSERFPSHPFQCEYDELYISKNKPGSKSKVGALSTTSRCEESWHEVDASSDKTKGKVKNGITIKHNQIKTKTVTSSFTAKDQADPYDFDFECTIRSGDMQQFVPYKSWSMYSPAMENKKPQTVSQEDKHQKSKKLNGAKSVFRSSQISCQRKITFADSKKNIDHTGYAYSDTYRQKDKCSANKTKKQKSSNDLGGRRNSSPHIFESQDQCCWKQKSSGYFTSEPDTPKSSESGLRFPPLQDYSPVSLFVHNDAELDINSFCDKSTSGRSELSWVKAKKAPSQEVRKQRGKTYGDRKECALNFQKQIIVSDVENDDFDEELSIASWRSGVIMTSPCKEIMSPLQKSPLSSYEQSMDFDTNSVDETDKQDSNTIKQGLGTLSSILCNTDTEKKNAVKDKYSSYKNALMKTSHFEESSQDSELQEDSKSTSPKLSLGGSSQNLSSLSLKFDHLFQEVMSKVSRDEPDLCSEMESVNPVCSGPSSKQRLTKSALKRKYPTLSSVSFSDDTEPKRKKGFPKVVKRKLFMSETESEVKRKCSNSSVTTPDISPIAPFNLSLLTSPFFGFSKASSGSSLSVEHTQCATAISKLAEEEEDPLSQNDSDISDMSSEIMFPTSNRTKLLESVIQDTSSYDTKSQLEDVFRCVYQPWKYSKLTKQTKRLKSFSTYMESLQSAYTKMRKTEREMKRTEAETAMLWYQQLQKMKHFRNSQEDSLGEMRKAYDAFTDELQTSLTGEENFKVSMKKSLTKDYEDLKKNLRAKYNTHSLEAIKRCFQASIMFS